MNFIIPQNYKFNAKLFGIIEYQTAILIAIWAIIIFFFVNFIFRNLNFKIFTFIILFFPGLIFSIVGVNGENILSVLVYFFKFLIKPKLLFYKKNYNYDIT